MQALIKELQQYKRKYYLNQLLRGVLVGSALLLTAYLFVNTLEYFGRFPGAVRAVLLFSFLSLSLFTLFYWILRPVGKLAGLSKSLSDEDAASQIGHYFPEVADKLLNTLQLSRLSASSNNSLLLASIEQRSAQLSVFRFPEAIDLRENRKYLRYLLPPLLLLLLLSFVWQGFIQEGTTRLLYYNQSFAPQAPFRFELKNNSLEAFRNEDFELDLQLKGQSLPQEVYLWVGNSRYKMKKDKDGFSYTFSKIQKVPSFYFEAAGFYSDSYTLTLRERPSLNNFSVSLSYPAYLSKGKEEIKNIGNLTVPQGTQIEWLFAAQSTDSLLIQFGEQAQQAAEKPNSKQFRIRKQMMQSQNYRVELLNAHSKGKEDINYFINVVPDQYPRINAENYQDTALYNYLMVGGNIADDYGLSQLLFHYRVVSSKQENSAFTALPIAINPTQTIQNFYYQFNTASLRLQPGDRIEYFLQVWDNDGVNGRKSSRTALYQFRLPSEKELKEDINNTIAQTENKIDQSLRRAKELQKQLQELEAKFKTKKNLDYNDKKQIEEVLRQREALEKDIKQLQELNQLGQQKQERFGEKSEQMKEKMEQLQKLMDNLLDEETRKLYEELEKLLDKNRIDPKVLEMMKNLEKNDEVLEKELERALEMFKQMQYEQKLEQATQDLKKMAEEQQKLAEKTEQQANKQDTQGQEQLQKEQEKLNEDFKELQKTLEELEKQNQELQEPNPSLDTEQDGKEVEEQQQKSAEQLQQKQNKNAAQSQKKAGQKMKEMSEKMEQMQQEGEMEMLQENIDDLRDILENLLTLSFGQEKLLKDFRGVNLSDPRFVELAQQQIKLQDDARIIEDSLTALSKRVFQIESFVTKELSNMKSYMRESSEAIKDRKIGQTSAKQQMSMTSMNNLALLLNDILSQMQDQMQNAQSGGKGKKKQKQSGKQLGQMQQMLNQQIQDLKKSGKTGKELSEELAKLAAQQEALRRMVEEMKKNGQMGKGGGGNNINELLKKMEETEKDLVNKKLNDELLQRQKDIETRLLEAEKSMRERDEEEKRKGETAQQKDKQVPKTLEQYIRNKDKQVELLKTVPPALSPYYKKEVDKYFEQLEK